MRRMVNTKAQKLVDKLGCLAEVDGNKVVFGGDVQADGSFLDSQGHPIGGASHLYRHQIELSARDVSYVFSIINTSNVPFTSSTVSSAIYAGMTGVNKITGLYAGIYKDSRYWELISFEIGAGSIAECIEPVLLYDTQDEEWEDGSFVGDTVTQIS